ncbi:hypothetical protein O3G_MSEX009807 [Manduca sexta]|uniref:Uncharacterized protein n=1 Tax=Manduca sexta TaxID=7130 RepID=A0A921ZF99_MANSE|nr:hypothetical protein O3G_MSEX009807 [Manduca sexta]
MCAIVYVRESNTVHSIVVGASSQVSVTGLDGALRTRMYLSHRQPGWRQATCDERHDTARVQVVAGVVCACAGRLYAPRCFVSIHPGCSSDI